MSSQTDLANPAADIRLPRRGKVSGLTECNAPLEAFSAVAVTNDGRGMIDPLEAALIIEERTKARLASRKKKVENFRKSVALRIEREQRVKQQLEEERKKEIDERGKIGIEYLHKALGEAYKPRYSTEPKVIEARTYTPATSADAVSNVEENSQPSRPSINTYLDGVSEQVRFQQESARALLLGLPAPTRDSGGPAADLKPHLSRHVSASSGATPTLGYEMTRAELVLGAPSQGSQGVGNASSAGRPRIRDQADHYHKGLLHKKVTSADEDAMLRGVIRKEAMALERAAIQKLRRKEEQRQRSKESQEAKAKEVKKAQEEARQVAEAHEKQVLQQRVEAQKQEEKAKLSVEQQKRFELQEEKAAERYIDALRNHAIARLKERGIEIPRLCQCAPDKPPFDGAWRYCASNCMYYKNPKLYTRDLLDLFRGYNLA